MTQWKISVNKNKFKAIFITGRRTKQLPSRPLHLGDCTVNWESRCKYLGMILDSRATLAKHIEYAVDKTQKAVRVIYSLINRRSHLHTNNKLRLFKTSLRPIYTYGSPIIVKAAPSNLQKLQILQNKLLRMVLDIRWDSTTYRFSSTVREMHENNNIETVAQFINRLTTNFLERLQQQLN